MPKRNNRAPQLNTSTLTQNSRIELAEAVRLIAQRIADKPNDTERTKEDRIRQVILYAKKKGKLAKLGGNEFAAGELLPWANQQWPGCTADLSSAFKAVQATANIQMENVQASGCIHTLPNDVSSCHARIQALEQEKQTLLDQLNDAMSQIEALKPDAERYRKIKRQNRENGRSAKRK